MQVATLKKSLVTLITALFIALSGCAVQLTGSYDDAIEKGMTAFQKKMETFLVGLEMNDSFPACSYKKNTQFYLETKVDLSAIKVRAAAIPKNKITVEQLELLTSSLGTLEQLHKLKDKKSECIPAQEIVPLRVAFNTSATAILKLELAKKRGEE